MKKQRLLLCFNVLMLLCCFVSCAGVKDPNECRIDHNAGPFKSNTSIIIFKESVDDLSLWPAEPGMEILPMLKMAVLTDSDESLLEALERDERVSEILPDEINIIPKQVVQINDDLATANEVTMSWGVDRVNAPLLWARGITGQGISVAVLDTGAIKDFPDLAGKIVAGKNFTNVDEDDWNDREGHGTTVASIIAADTNGEFIRGVAPGVSLYIAKVVADSGIATDSAIVRALEWALERKVRIANMSLGSYKATKGLETGLARAFNHGLFMVAAAGNEGHIGCHGSNVESPGVDSHVMAVSATQFDEANTIANFSSHGPEVDIAAPGQALGEISNVDPLTYGQNEGTSYASPHVAGVAALLLSASPLLKPEELTKLIERGARDLGYPGLDDYYGYGLVDAASSYFYLIHPNFPN